jgi:hypothetical protein
MANPFNQLISAISNCPLSRAEKNQTGGAEEN